MSPTGLHFEDIRVLLGILNILVDKGNTVMIIEHNLDVIEDYIFDIGPEGEEMVENWYVKAPQKSNTKPRKSYCKVLKKRVRI